MTIKHLFSALFILASAHLFSQSFQEIPLSLPGLANGGSCWGDYDNDGDLDLVINGQRADWTSATVVYENINDVLTEVPGEFPALYQGTARWGDYDNDDDLDLLVCGMNDLGEGITLLFNNDSGIFSAVDTPFTGITQGIALWVDENRDNWLDVVVAGDSSYYTPVARLYHNNGDGTFLQVDAKLPASLSASYTFGDYDNDGDEDLFITGFFEYTYASRLMRNDGEGSFTDTQIPFDSVAYGYTIFLDIDKDLDLDIIYMGNDLTGAYIARVYRNDGNDIFTKLSSGIVGEWVGQIDVADFDHDGDPDLAITGALCCGEALTELYVNDGEGHFTVFQSNLPARSFSQIRFGDFDNDGDADLLLTGIAEMTTGLPMTQIFRNTMGTNTFGTNDPPEEPQGLMVDIDLNDVTFHWSPSTDDKTPSAALTYNLYLGTAPASCDVLSPVTNPDNGFRRVFSTGNVNQDTAWRVKDLPAGTYYWSVQALDHSLSGSGFSPEQSFEITYIGMEENLASSIITIYPNPASSILNVRSEVSGKIEIFDIHSRLTGSYMVSVGINSIDVTGLAKGIYLLRVTAGDHLSSNKFIKE
ncbi:MAG: T9SS type A sorting domain-containing protein [Bacteroidales bacterium]|nr:T9SS type A sorting domain-containing protein [Bacteroidales bacterium]